MSTLAALFFLLGQHGARQLWLHSGELRIPKCMIVPFRAATRRGVSSFNSVCGVVAGSSQTGGRSRIVFNNRFHQSLSAIFYAQHMDIEKEKKKGGNLEASRERVLGGYVGVSKWRTLFWLQTCVRSGVGREFRGWFVHLRHSHNRTVSMLSARVCTRPNENMPPLLVGFFF